MYPCYMRVAVPYRNHRLNMLEPTCLLLWIIGVIRLHWAAGHCACRMI